MDFVTRGFQGRPRGRDERLPPGQYLTGDFPVLSAGPTPVVDHDEWELWVATEDGTRHTWSWRVPVSYTHLTLPTILLV